jgi:HK97 family phage prohead protease
MKTPPAHTIERRYTPGLVELRADAADGKQARIGGYAAKFGTRSENMGWGDTEYFEVIEPGFFDNVLEDDCRCLFNHDANLILGRNTSKTLRISQDGAGLGYECDADDGQSYTRDLLISLRRKDVTQSSFAFSVGHEGQRIVEEGKTITRYLKKGGCMRLYDVSPVTYPAYPAATSEARDIRAFLDEARRDGLISKDAAEALAHAAARRARELQLAELES